ncbi:MAG: hypothetical protein A3C38_04295 [Planctomycetes bacterium RIFCSPHIGHO2_02_FULL_50_42]|nr:MAG: hypothetical protein A3C38_04295 [Planctomycetes bacterium RIFCSPHIGHO2_02_FULL_50_42]OHB92255.1 MAG: hypothetical protein A3E75_01135 [Planctomycetes bacterium RIFCSPHIGHO2_12_FULL_51_37]OHB94636.1 MAG: hypothetical protein A3I59_06115 [Planctomycetes bacterium RIFCSPLOWO2_02_FULL_50_16]OHC03638.1 MAG: hypothetical protein A3G17_00980 [Planctomycetes bacterium RIFCSPLOWO2_12_FULL_50_35]
MKRPYLFVSVFLCSVLLPFVTIFCGIPCCRSVLGQEPCGKAVTTNPAFQYYPQIWGTNILWLDRRSGNSDMFIYNFAKGREVRVPPGHEEVNSINIYKDNVVYQVWGGNWDVWLLNIKSGNKRQISANHSWHEMLPRIWGDSVVWEDWRNGYGLGDIYLYNLKTKETRQITTDPGAQGKPDIYKDVIVWHDKRNGNWDIYLYDLDKGEERRLTDDPADQFSPVIHGDHVVWVDSRNGNWDIFTHNLSTGTTTCICNDPSKQWWPQIWKNTILWVDERAGESAIYVYDITTGKGKPLCNSPAPQRQPAIYENRIVWMDFRNGAPGEMRQGNWDIFATSLPMYHITTSTSYP